MFRTGFNVQKFLEYAEDIKLVRSYADDVPPNGDDAELLCRDESLTVQSGAEDADINVIVKRFARTGQLPVIERPPLSGDFSEVVTDYHSAAALVREADERFMELPAEVRSRFENNAGKFVDFCSDPANLPEMRKLGVAVPEKSPPAKAAPMEVVVVSGGAVSEPKASA